MQEERIRLNSTTSVNSVNRKNLIDVTFKQHVKPFSFGNVFETIDQRQQFETERGNCTKYRVILTINPYCSNILFNTLTEIVQNEGSDNPDKFKFVNVNDEGVSVDEIGDYTIKGKSKKVTNVDMVRNTEYSNGNEPFIYHCGWDIFNNHILRNQTFKLVNRYEKIPYDIITPSGSEKVNVFNTIRDYMRDADGEPIQLYTRADVNTINKPKERRLYLADDILSFEDSANVNLFEQNGWFGFNNRSTITTTEWDNKAKDWKNMYTSKVLNNENNIACGFIEMYPDSSLYSFNPKYNKFQNREEYNWDICITYPYKNDFGYVFNKTENKIVLTNGYKMVLGFSGNGEDYNIENVINGLLIADIKQSKGTSGQDILLFKTFVKHNLRVGDKFKLFYSSDKDNYMNGFAEIEDILFEVVNVGDLNNESQDYFFYINNIQDLYDSIGESDLGDYCFRFVKVNNGRDCKYYYRKFKKLPNFKFKKRDLTDEESCAEGKLNTYIDENCKRDGKMVLFGKEQYPLAFSNTIYGDGNTQIVFTDSIDIDKFIDNLGRPLTELYVTIIKRNKGHDIWYEKTQAKETLKKIEFSHCFSEVISGLKMLNETVVDDPETDDIDEYEEINELRKNLGDITRITTKEGQYFDRNIDIDTTDEFYGDLVELDQTTMTETTLSDICFRFNTEQRENGGEENVDCGKYAYDEIVSDDYDYKGFICDENELEKEHIERKEGYFYKAHYPIKVREFGAFRQGSHKEIKISKCNPKQSNGMFIEVVSTSRSGVTSGSVVYLYDTEQNNKKIAELTVNSVQSSVRFLLNTMKRGDENYISIFDIIKGLLYSERSIKSGEMWVNEDGLEEIAEEDMTVNDYSRPKYIIRLKNIDIPQYAYEVGGNSNIFIWRDILSVGDKDANELIEYPFANGHFYVNKDINFFLKRQDPFGYNGLYSSKLSPNDVFGNVKKENIYEYKDETNIVC